MNFTRRAPVSDAVDLGYLEISFFLTGSQVMLMLLVQRPCSENHWLLLIETIHPSLRPVWPAASLYMALELRMVFTFLNGWEEKHPNTNILLYGYYIKYKFQCPSIKLHRNSHVHLFSCCLGLFSWLMAELRSYNTDWRAHKIFTVWIFTDEVCQLFYYFKCARDLPEEKTCT